MNARLFIPDSGINTCTNQVCSPVVSRMNGTPLAIAITTPTDNIPLAPAQHASEFVFMSIPSVIMMITPTKMNIIDNSPKYHHPACVINPKIGSYIPVPLL